MKRKKQKPKEAASRKESLTRRDFLKGASVAVSSGLLITEAHAASLQQGRMLSLAQGLSPSR